MYVSLWLVRAAELPTGCLPPGSRLATMFGRTMVATAFAVYDPSGVLAYNELLAAAPVRLGRRSLITIMHIWVDHRSSIAGARALWSIPKEAAAFEVSRGTDRVFKANAAISEVRPIAALDFRSRLALPGRWPLRTTTVQSRRIDNPGEGVKITNARAVASIELGSATWDFVKEGPLAYLRGRTPFVSARLARMSLCFGE
jgi:hypothetical protein